MAQLDIQFIWQAKLSDAPSKRRGITQKKKMHRKQESNPQSFDIEPNTMTTQRRYFPMIDNKLI